MRAVDRLRRDHGEQTAQEPLPPIRLCEAMTVNHVLHTYPQTRMLLGRLFINVPYEGSDCLDEVAWRHGMDSRQLLLLLEEAISVGGRCEEAAAA